MNIPYNQGLIVENIRKFSQQSCIYFRYRLRTKYQEKYEKKYCDELK